MIPAENGKEYRPGDPEFEELELQFTQLKAMIKGQEIYGRKLTELEFMTLFLALSLQLMPAEVAASLEELSGKGYVPALDQAPGLLARFQERFASIAAEEEETQTGRRGRDG